MASKNEIKETQEESPLALAIANLKSTIEELKKERESKVKELGSIDETLQSIRQELNEFVDEDDEDEDEETPRRPRKKRQGRMSNGKNLIDYTREALGAAGEKGLIPLDIAQAVKKLGFQTNSSDENFAKSVYVSGIIKLRDNKEVESYKPEKGEAVRHRLTKKGQASLKKMK